VIGCEPIARDDVVKVATPAALIAPVPRTVEPSRKVIVPVAPAVTDAVKVIGVLAADGLAEETSVTVGAVFPTVTVVAGEVAGLLFASPGVLAVMESLPSGRFDTVIVATPPTTGAVPIVVPPLLNVTGPETPVGTVSVIVTGAPAAGDDVDTPGGGNVGVTLPIVSTNGAEVAAPLLASPP